MVDEAFAVELYDVECLQHVVLLYDLLCLQRKKGECKSVRFPHLKGYI
jgi:hypothetical protein